MTLFLILAPYGAFASLMLLSSAKASVLVTAAICLAVIALDFVRGRSLKLLGAGSAILFAAIGLYLMLIDPTLGNSAAKLSVDAGIFAISLTSILIRRPFTLQYALEAVPAETAGLPGLLRQLHHHRRLDRRRAGDDGRQFGDALCAAPPADQAHCGALGQVLR
jgi:hypothetical protein